MIHVYCDLDDILLFIESQSVMLYTSHISTFSTLLEDFNKYTVGNLLLFVIYSSFVCTNYTIT